MHHTIAHVLLWVLAAAATAPAIAAGQGRPELKGSDTTTDALWARLVSDPDQPYASIIATVSSRKLVQARFRHVCGHLPALVARTSVLDVPDVCWSLRGACHRVFKSSITGALVSCPHLGGTTAIVEISRVCQAAEAKMH
jgi:hypothetical protein